MIILENVTLYKCEYCAKKQFRKCDMSKHEKWCKKNPANMHKCFQHCIHLEKGSEEIEGSGSFYEQRGNVVRCTFTCALTLQRMYSFIAERRGITIVEGEIRMPLTCDKYYSDIEQSLDHVFNQNQEPVELPF